MDLSSIASSINYRYQTPSTLQMGGLMTGLNTADIIDAILEIEARPMQSLNTRYEQLDLKASAYQQLDDQLESFADFLTTFKLQASFFAKTTSVSDEDILDVNASASTSAGTYLVKIVSFATYSSLSAGRTVGRDDITSSETFGSLSYRYTPEDSSLKIQKGTTTYDVSISTTDTIDDIISKLEAVFGAGNVTFSSGKLRIESDESFAISQENGNFLEVFHLDSAPLIESSGTYSMESVTHVGAVSTSNTLDQIASFRSLTLNAGNITINGVSINVDPANDTLSSLISAINTSDAGVTALYDETMDKILLTSNTTGSNVISIDDGGTGISELLGWDSSTFQAGSSGHIQVSPDGTNWSDVYSSGNDFTYQGLTITVNQFSSETQTITVTNDIDSVVENIKEFVNRWNTLMDYIYTKLNEDPVEQSSNEELTDEEQMQGILKNDRFLEGIFNKLRGFITTQIQGDINYLWQIGISTSSSLGTGGYENMVKGQLEVDEDQLREALTNNPEAVWEFFGGNDSEEGLAVQIQDYIRELTKFGGEIDKIAGTSGSIDKEKRFIAVQLTDWIRRIQRREQQLWRQFSVMEQVVGQLQAQSAWLSQATQRSST
ncbi:MAG: flagellar hook protein [Thermotogae bacterium]|nr:MAG: flagellar hook protein [Thermotogota bacterium]